MTDASKPRSARGVYGIAVTSELSGVGPQTLRLYERRGLLSPSRTDGGTRRYSDDDLERLRRITELVDQGVNLAGIAHILDLETRNSQLESDYTQLEVLNATPRQKHGGRIPVTADVDKTPEPLPGKTPQPFGAASLRSTG